MMCRPDAQAKGKGVFLNKKGGGSRQGRDGSRRQGGDSRQGRCGRRRHDDDQYIDNIETVAWKKG